MKSSAKFLIIGLLALSLGLKLAAAGGMPEADLAFSSAATARFLGRYGFDAEVRHMVRAPFLLVVARRGDCRLAIGDYTPYGTFADVYRRLAEPIGPLRYAWRGSVHARPPRIRALGAFYVWRELRRIGVAAPRVPILAVAASPQCDLAELPWREVASFPR